MHLLLLFWHSRGNLTMTTTHFPGIPGTTTTTHFLTQRMITNHAEYLSCEYHRNTTTHYDDENIALNTRATLNNAPTTAPTTYYAKAQPKYYRFKHLHELNCFFLLLFQVLDPLLYQVLDPLLFQVLCL